MFTAKAAAVANPRLPSPRPIYDELDISKKMYDKMFAGWILMNVNCSNAECKGTSLMQSTIKHAELVCVCCDTIYKLDENNNIITVYDTTTHSTTTGFMNSSTHHINTTQVNLFPASILEHIPYLPETQRSSNSSNCTSSSNQDILDAEKIHTTASKKEVRLRTDSELTANSMPTEIGTQTDREDLSIAKEIEDEVGFNNPVSNLKPDEYECQYPNQNYFILLSYGYFNTNFMIFSLVGFWLSVVYSYATCKIPLATPSSYPSSPPSVTLTVTQSAVPVPVLEECFIYSAEVSLCTITLIVCFIAHLFSIFVRVPYLRSYEKKLLLRSNNEYDLLEILQIYLLKGELSEHMTIKFLKRYIFTLLLSILLNFGTLFESNVWRWSAPDLFCGLLGWSFILVYVDFNANTVMLRDMLLKGTHITGFTGGKRRKILKSILMRFKSATKGNQFYYEGSKPIDNSQMRTSFILESIRILKSRKRFLMDSLKISYIESTVTVIMSLYYMAHYKHIHFRAFTISVLNLSMIPMICTTVASINHNKCITMLEDVIKTIAMLRGDKDKSFRPYGAITTTDEKAIDQNMALPLSGNITNLQVDLFTITISDAFFLNILITLSTAVLRAFSIRVV